jgi:hypothetical protein
MRNIDEIIAEAEQAIADAHRQAFALGRAEAALELKARMEALLAPSTEPGEAGPSLEADRADGSPLRKAHRPATRPALLALLLGAAAILSLALAHARAARTFPACVLLVALGALLRNWTAENALE